MEVLIRIMKETDVPQVAAIYEEKRLTENILAPEPLREGLKLLAHPCYGTPGSVSLVAVVDSLVVACGQVVWYRIGSKGVIDQREEIVTLKAYEGHGIGRRLLDQLEILAKDMGSRTSKLSVHEDNERAIRIYRENGFVVKAELLMIKKHV